MAQKDPEIAWYISYIRVVVNQNYVSIVLTISGAHRKGVFNAAIDAMNQIKKGVPIWKKETSQDKSVWKEDLLI